MKVGGRVRGLLRFVRVLGLAIFGLLMGGIEEEAQATAGTIVFYSTSTASVNLPPSYSTSVASGFAGGETKLSAQTPTGHPNRQYRLVASTLTARAILTASGDNNRLSIQSWNGSAWTLLADNISDPAAAIRSVDTAFFLNDSPNYRALIVYKVGTAAANLTWRMYFSTANTLGATTSLTALPSAVYRWVRLETQPGSNNILLVAFNDTSDQYEIAWFDGDSQTWTSVGPVTGSDLGSTTMAQWFDMAFEQNGNRAVIAMEFNDATADYIAYSTWTSAGGLSASTMTIPTPTGASINHFQMRGKPGSSEITLLVSSGTGASPELGAYIWTGSSWTASVVISANVGHAVDRPFDAAYESLSGDAVITYRSADLTTVAFRTRASGSHTWGTETAGPDLDTGDGEALEVPRWISLTPDPATDDVYLMANDGSSTDGTLSDNVEVHWAKWDGGTWGAVQTPETDTTNRGLTFGMAFPGTGAAGDVTAPAGISNLTALQTANEGEIRLDWTSPGDDGETGALPAGSEFRIRYTTTTMIKSADFNSPPSTMAVTSVNISTNTGALQAQTTTFFNLTGTITRYFAIKTADESSNVSVWNSSADVATVNTSALISPAQFPPGGVSNLTALSGSVEGEIVLRWKAPGDDGETGTLNTSTFSIKYSSINVITSADFDSPPVSLYVTTITISTTSVAAGINVSTIVSNLTVGTIYWFAIKTRDDLENWSVWTSSIDNSSFNTLASTVSGAVAPNLFLNGSDISHTNLTAEPLIVVYVTATIRNNGGTVGYSGPTYVTFFATNTTTTTDYFISQATLGVVTPALSGSTQAFSGAWQIPVEGLYNYWVKIDSANTISESNENDNNASITAEHPVSPPAGISNLTALTGPIEGTVVLRWTAPGDDGTVGIVTGYALRIASAPIKSADFNSSWVQVTTPAWASNPSGNGLGVSGGTDVSVTLTGLLAGGVTYFALRAFDDVSAYSVWNSTFENASFNTLVSTWVQVDVTAPSAITTLAATLYSPTGIVTLTWTAPSEDGTWGTSGATYYDIRYATFSFTDRTAAGVLVATYTAGTFTPGSNEIFRIGPGYGGVISGLRSGQDYFFNIWSQDERGNLSDVSSPEASTPVVHLVISELVTGRVLDGEDEWIELFNPTTAAIDLSVMGITLHKITAGGTDSNFSLAIRPGRESIPSNGFWLITDRVGYTLTVSSDADFATGNAIAADNAFYISTYAAKANTHVYIDLVGMGTNPNFETTATSNPSEALTDSIERRASGGLDPTVSPGNTQGNGSDTNDNNSDFVVRDTPDPQNSLSAVEGDTRIPGGISNLTALAQSNGDVILEWTSPGDDEQAGSLLLGSQFRIKYSSVAILSSSNFDSPGTNLAVSTITISTTAVAGSAQRRTITGLSGGLFYWFAIKTKDEVGNWSVWNSTADNASVNTLSTATVTAHLGASVDIASFDFGTLQTGTTNVSTSSGSVTNTGNVTQRFLVRVSNSADFTLTTSAPGLNEFRYSIVFSTATPVSSDFDTNDAANTTNTAPTASVFARDSDAESVKGFNVSPGATRFLWMRFEAPTSVNVGNQQNIFVTVVAEQQP